MRSMAFRWLGFVAAGGVRALGETEVWSFLLQEVDLTTVTLVEGRGAGWTMMTIST